MMTRLGHKLNGKAIGPLLVGLVLPLLAACGGAGDQNATGPGRTGQSVNPGGYQGLVVADEPNAIDAAQSVLNAGGNAADAAAAIYFALSVSLPDAAGLAGGGACLYWDNGDKLAYGVLFPTRSGKDGGIIGVPGNVAGFDYLQARFGDVAWGSVVAPAERMARYGHRMSRANAVRFDRVDGSLKAALVGIGINRNAANKAAREGDRITNPALAEILSNIRAGGGRSFYAPGMLSTTMLRAIRRAGGRVTAEDLAGYRPQIGLEQVEVRDAYTLFLHGGVAASPLVAALVSGAPQRTTRARIESRAEEERKAMGLGHGGSPSHTGSTGFAVVDVRGNAASCAVTMGRPFGGAGLARDLGISFAPPADSERVKEAAEGLVPMMVIENGSSSLELAAVASGGLGAAEAAAVLAQNHIADQLNDNSSGLSSDLADANRDPAVSISAVKCPQGADQRLAYCSAQPDSVGYGLAKLITALPR